MMAPTQSPSKLLLDSTTESKIQIANGVVEAITKFPQKLYKMLECASDESFEDIISWEPNGRCFVVRDADKFVKEVLPRFFSFSRLYIFNRRLRSYGFTQGFQGIAEAYHHKFFLKGEPDLVSRVSEVDAPKKFTSMPPPPRLPLVKKQAGPTTTSMMLEDQSVVTSSSTSHRSKGIQSDDDCSLTEVEESSGAEDSAWEEEQEEAEEEEQQKEERVTPVPKTPLTQAAEQKMNSDSFLQDLLCDFAMDLDELHPSQVLEAPSEGAKPQLYEPTVREMSPPSAAAAAVHTMQDFSSFSQQEETKPAPSGTAVTVALLNTPAAAPLMKAVGPLQTPGRLRNGFGLGIRAVCIHAVPKGRFHNRGTVVSNIVSDPTHRNEFERVERERYERPLLQPISKELNHIVWPSVQEELDLPKELLLIQPDTTVSQSMFQKEEDLVLVPAPATSCAITDHDELVAL